MTKRAFRRTLSIIICAAMLLSVFAGSFTVRAEDTTTTENYSYNWTFNKDEDTAKSDLKDMLNNHSEYINTADENSFTYDSENKCLKITGEGYNGMAENRGFRGIIFKNKTYTNGATLRPSKIEVESPETLSQFSRPIIAKTSNTGVIIGKTFHSSKGETRNLIAAVYCLSNTNEWQEAKLRLTECNGPHDDKSLVINTNIILFPDGKGGTKKLQDVFGKSFVHNDLKYLTYKYNASIDDNENVTITVTVTYAPEGKDPVPKTADPITINLENLKNYTNTTFNKKEIDENKTTEFQCSDITAFQPLLGIARFATNSANESADDSKLNYVTAEYVPYKLSATAQVVLGSGIYLRIEPKVEGDINQSTIKIHVGDVEVSTGNREYDIEKYAHQMTDSMLIRLTAKTTDGTACSYTINNGSYSIADNLEHLYNNYDEEYKPLIAKLANYGAAAQAYDELANNITYSKKANDFLDDTAKVTSGDAYKTFSSCNASGSFYDAGSGVFNSTDFKAGLSLALQGKVKMAVLVSKITISDGQTLSVKMGDETADFEYDESRGLYTAVFGTFSPKDYGETKSIQLVRKNSDGTEVATSGTAGYSVGAYIYRMAGKATTSDGLKLLLNALAEYQDEFAKMYDKAE